MLLFAGLCLPLSACQLVPNPGTPCTGKACDPGRWVFVSALNASNDRLRETISLGVPYADICQPAYVLALEWPASGARPAAGAQTSAEPFRGLTGFDVRPTGDLRIAVATVDGRLLLAALGSPHAQQVLDMSAVGLAWSNAGDKLAVVVRDPSAPAAEAHRLAILTPELAELAAFGLDLPLSDPTIRLRHDRFVVSWSADDQQVAVSTTIACAPPLGDCSFPDAQAFARCIVVDVDTGSEASAPLFDAYYVGAGRMVATVPPGDAGPYDVPAMSHRVYDVRWQDGHITSRRFLLGPRFVIASAPASGVFLTVDGQLSSINTVVSPVSIRTPDGSRQRVGAASVVTLGPFGDRVSLVSLDNAQPALTAAGFGPDDIPMPDPNTGGCPPLEPPASQPAGQAP